MPVERAIQLICPRWLAAGVAALLLPKCLLCLAGYAALAGGFAAARPELCGGLATPPDGVMFAAATFGVMVGAGLLLYAGRRPTSNRPAGNPGSDHRP